MRLLRIFMFLPLTLAAIGVAAYQAVDRMFGFLAESTDVHALRDLFGMPRLELSIGNGHQVDAATQHHLRHEAGLPRLGSVRHT